MVEVIIELTAGYGKINHLLKRYPQNLKDTSYQGITAIAKAIQKSAKLRAPRSKQPGGGFLASQIKVIPESPNTIKVSSGSYYAMAQEMGYRPHWVSLSKHPILWEWAQYNFANPVKKGYYYVKEYKPYIRPAVESVRGKIPRILKKAVLDAAKRSKE